MAPPLTLTLILTLTLALALTQMELRDVHVSIPVPAADAPTVTDGEGASFNKREGVLTWVIPVIDSANGSGSIEFTAAVDSPDAFFPIDVRPEPNPEPNPNSNPSPSPNPNPNPNPSPNPDPNPNPTPNPNQVRFHSQKTFCEMEVPAVLSAEDGSSVPFGKVGGLSVETYRVN